VEHVSLIDLVGLADAIGLQGLQYLLRLFLVFLGQVQRLEDSVSVGSDTRQENGCLTALWFLR
jgi:hypothetical protein